MGDRARAVNGVVGGDCSFCLGGMGMGEEGRSDRTTGRLDSRGKPGGLTRREDRFRCGGAGRPCDVVPARWRSGRSAEGRAELILARHLCA